MMKETTKTSSVSWKLAGSTAAALLLLSESMTSSSVVYTCQALELQVSSSSGAGRGRPSRSPSSSGRSRGAGRSPTRGTTSKDEAVLPVANLEDYFAPIRIDGGAVAPEEGRIEKNHAYSADFANLLAQQRPLVSTVLSRGREVEPVAGAVDARSSSAMNAVQQPFAAEHLGGGSLDGEPRSLLTKEEKTSLATAGRGWGRTALGASIEGPNQVAQLQRSRVVTVFARNFLRSLLAYQPRHLMAPREVLLTVPPREGRRGSDAAETTREGFPPIAEVERTASLLLALGELKKPTVDRQEGQVTLRLESRKEATYYRNWDPREDDDAVERAEMYRQAAGGEQNVSDYYVAERRPKLTAVFEFALNTHNDHGRTSYAELRKVAVQLRHTPLEPVNRWPWYQTQSWVSQVVIASPEIIRKAFELGGKEQALEICGAPWWGRNRTQPLPPPTAELNIHTRPSSTRTTSENQNYEVRDCSYEEHGGVADEEMTIFAPVESGNAVWTPEGREKVTRSRQAGLVERPSA
ncbi:unnamed protein product [Amoebophrya sp. A120]|nr:unnamed protein product [Amoebophrya sp. A120]|eukprot:GSA120T00014597001.1